MGAIAESTGVEKDCTVAHKARLLVDQLSSSTFV